MSNHAATRYPNPRHIEDLESHIRAIITAIEHKYDELSDAQRRRLVVGLNLRVPVCRLREQLADLHEQYDLLIAEFDFRRI